MTLNYDCIRDVLLYLEDTLEYTDNQMAMTHKRLTISKSVGRIPIVSTKSVAPFVKFVNKSIPFLIVSESMTLNQKSCALLESC